MHNKKPSHVNSKNIKHVHARSLKQVQFQFITKYYIHSSWISSDIVCFEYCVNGVTSVSLYTAENELFEFG